MLVGVVLIRAVTLQLRVLKPTEFIAVVKRTLSVLDMVAVQQKQHI